MDKPNNGAIRISQQMVARNRMKMNLFDLFKYELSLLHIEMAGWYAYRYSPTDAYHEIKWCRGSYRPSDNYLRSLEDDGWITIRTALK